MRQYEVTALSVMINHGILELSPEQAGVRRHLLCPREEGQYEVSSPVQFKRGEQFGWNGEGNKTIMIEITPVSVEVGDVTIEKSRRGKK